MGALFPQTIRENPVVILNETDGNVAKDLVTDITNGTKVYSVNAYNNGSAVISVFVAIKTGTVTGIISKVDIPANGTANLLAVANIPSVMEDGSLLIGPGSILQVYTETLPQAGESVHIVAQTTAY